MPHAILYLAAAIIAAAIIARFWHTRIWWVYVAFAHPTHRAQHRLVFRSSVAESALSAHGPLIQAATFAVNSIPNAFITAIVVFNVGLPFSLNDR